MKDDTSFSRGERYLSRFFLFFLNIFCPELSRDGPGHEKMKELTAERSSEKARRDESGRNTDRRESFF
jgi:hypothetical protein